MAANTTDVQSLRDTVDFYRKWFITICVPLLSLICAYLVFRTEATIMSKSHEIFATKEALSKTDVIIKEHSTQIHELVPYRVYDKDFTELRKKVIEQGELIASMNSTLKALQEVANEIRRDVKDINKNQKISN